MNINSKIMSISAAAAMLVSALSFNTGAVIETRADFEKNAAQTVADMGFGWNLGNSFDSY